MMLGPDWASLAQLHQTEEAQTHAGSFRSAGGALPVQALARLQARNLR